MEQIRSRMGVDSDPSSCFAFFNLGITSLHTGEALVNGLEFQRCRLLPVIPHHRVDLGNFVWPAICEL